MADQFGVEIQGVLKATLRFEQFPEAMRAELLKAIEKLTKFLAAKIRATAPGTIKSLVITQLFNDPDQVAGRVTVSGDFGKVGALEWGAPGRKAKKTVREHQAKLDHAWGNKLARPITVMIARHNRTLHLEARRFLRGPLASSQGLIEDVLHQAVVDVVNGVDA